MYTDRRMLKIPWTQKLTNKEVIIIEYPTLLYSIKKRKFLYLGHVFEEKIAGKRSVGHRQNSWLKDLCRWLGCISIELFRAGTSKIIFVNQITNLRRRRRSYIVDADLKFPVVKTFNELKLCGHKKVYYLLQFFNESNSPNLS